MSLTVPKQLHLSRLEWAEDLGGQVLPPKLSDAVLQMLSHCFNAKPAPEATKELEVLCLQHLPEGICLEHSGKRYEYYQIVVVEPDSGSDGKPFFGLQRKYPGWHSRSLTS